MDSNGLRRARQSSTHIQTLSGRVCARDSHTLIHTTSCYHGACGFGATPSFSYHIVYLCVCVCVNIMMYVLHTNINSNLLSIIIPATAARCPRKKSTKNIAASSWNYKNPPNMYSSQKIRTHTHKLHVLCLWRLRTRIRARKTDANTSYTRTISHTAYSQ